MHRLPHQNWNIAYLHSNEDSMFLADEANNHRALLHGFLCIFYLKDSSLRTELFTNKSVSDERCLLVIPLLRPNHNCCETSLYTFKFKNDRGNSVDGRVRSSKIWCRRHSVGTQLNAVVKLDDDKRAAADLLQPQPHFKIALQAHSYSRLLTAVPLQHPYDLY